MEVTLTIKTTNLLDTAVKLIVVILKMLLA